MSKIVNYPNKKSLRKKIDVYDIYLTRVCEIGRGKTWFCQLYRDDMEIGNGYHKTNKFSAVRNAIKDVELIPFDLRMAKEFSK